MVVALYQIRVERILRHRDEQRQVQRIRREQAKRISGWPAKDYKGSEQTFMVLLNRSDEPVYEVIVALVVVQGAGSYHGEDHVLRDERRILSVLPPGRWKVGIRSGWHGGSRFPGAEVAFTDRAGVHWIRRATGKLEEIQEPAIDHFKLHRPQGLGFPSQMNDVD